MRKGLLKQHHSWITLGLRLLDAGVVFSLLPLLTWLYGLSYSREYQMAALLAALLTWAIMGAMDAYRPWRGASLLTEARLILQSSLIIISMLLLVAWLSKSTQFYSRFVILWWFILIPLVIIGLHFAQRLLLRMLRKKGRNYRTAIVIGGGPLGHQLVKRIQEGDWMGIKLLGVFDDDNRKQGMAVADVPVLGKTADATAFVKGKKIDKVYLALPMHMETRILEIFDDLQDTTASVYLVPDLFIFRLMDARMQEMNGLPVFSLCETPFNGPFGLIKRIEDVILASLILLLISPLMLAIAIGIKLTSHGPVFFKQRRYGLNGNIVTIWKFRTMTVMEDDHSVAQTTRHDPRVTPFGRTLRSTSLDELPQFINVLQGRMSIVGPRPHAIAHNEQYRKLIKGYMWRHKVKPGITGWAQVNGWRGETDSLDKMEKRVEHDIDYIQNWSLWIDLKIILLTLCKGFRNKNAY